MKKTSVISVLFVLCIAATALMKKPASIGVDHTLHYFSAKTKIFIASLQELQAAIKGITQNTETVQQAKQRLANCRAAYKKLEFFVEHFFEARIRIFNGAPVYEVEEPHPEYQSPVGLQVIESLLFDEAPVGKKEELVAQTDLLLTTARGLPSYLYGRELQDEEIITSIRLELVRIMALGITGYDAPQLKTGIAEAVESIRAIQENLAPYLDRTSQEKKERTNLYFATCLRLLSQPVSFDKFNRLQFLTEAALPLQEEINSLAIALGYRQNSNDGLNAKAENIFSRAFIKPSGDVETDSALISLGKSLFFEKALSGNGKRSCATCHKPQHYFTDALVKSEAFNGHDQLRRNTPSVLYAAYQKAQFWDGHSGSLQDQIEKVLASHTEMNAESHTITKRLLNNAEYKNLFNAGPAEKNDSLLVIKRLAKAIAAYECSLPVMTSPFDAYMAGDKNALSAKAIQGFNLFMGKAACGTCHFAPLFNSLLPPAYNRTEFESLGMIASANFKKPSADKDSGRYDLFPVPFYSGVFKTPTVRNSAKTAPYMHNGVFKTLDEVIEFYNKGGGNGLGLREPYQTLPGKPLKLTAKEKACLIAFLHSLTDKPITDK